MTLRSHPVARHASAGSPVLRIFLPLGVAVTILGIIWALVDGAGANASRSDDGSGDRALSSVATSTPPRPAEATELPAVSVVTQSADPCSEEQVTQAIAAGDDNAVVALFGGGERFRQAVAAGSAPCINLADPTRLWLVVNKQRPLDPLDYAPASLVAPERSSDEAAGLVRNDVAEALSAMAAASREAGAGDLALGSGFRSYSEQVANYESHVERYGQEEADAVSARPGHSEHQTGLAADISGCDVECGGILDFGDTAQGQWVAEHGWEFGFIVRYTEGATGTTGYSPEPWHLRFIGTELARAYHEGGYLTLEQFFGLPDAPGYVH